MYFLILGIFLLLMKSLAFAPVVSWSWWLVLLPFLLAVLWWAWADWSGYTKRKVMESESARKQARIDGNREAMGMGREKKKRR